MRISKILGGHTMYRKPSIIYAITVVAALAAYMHASQAKAAIKLAEFDVTHAVSSSTAPISVINLAPGVTSSPLVPVGVNFGGVSTPGLYWDSSWTTAASPNYSSQRLFFNLFAGSGTTLTFDTLDFFIYSGGTSLVGVELRVFDGTSTSLFSPQLISSGMFNSPTGFASEVIVDVSSLPAIDNGEVYQFSLSFFARNPSSRVGLTGNRSDIGALGGNMILTGQSSAVPEPAGVVIWSALAGTSAAVVVARRQRRGSTRGPWTDENRAAILDIVAGNQRVATD